MAHGLHGRKVGDGIVKHEFRPIREAVPGDVVEVLACEGCGLRYARFMETGESLSGALLTAYPDCDALDLAVVMST